MFCGKCGNEFQDTYKFCPRCGEPAARQEEPSPDTNSSVLKKKRKGIGLAAVITVAVLAVTGTLGWFLLRKPASGDGGSGGGEKSSDTVTVYALVGMWEYDSDGECRGEAEYAFDDHGRLLRENHGFNSGTSYDCNSYTYDENGYLIRSEYESSSYGEYEYSDVYNYVWAFSGGVPVSRTISSEGEEREIVNEFFHQNGLLQKIITYYGDGSSETALTYRDGRLASIDADDVKREFEYAKNGNLTSFVLGDEYEYSMEYQYSYDSNGNLSGYILDNGYGSIIEGRFTYDDSGKHLTKVEIDFGDNYKYIAKQEFEGEVLKKATVVEWDCGIEENVYEYTLDEDGNVTRISDSFGDFVCFEYEKLVLSREDYEIYLRQVINRGEYYSPADKLYTEPVCPDRVLLNHLHLYRIIGM